ncbi:MAG: adenylyltransferase/cytidyltransferase family protein [Elusimicrobia bacterium]|nr:adenylyltransferase/cytidyltransferase family protein [Elusimicrobiota bacterium]MDE2510646.1 adenylyltransferase/cytidyltransferase family protein [Elusimicrobiota bacterium]
MKPSPSKILPLKKLLTLRELWRWEGRSVVFTNGVFDILHAGHVRVLEKARAQGDLLIVGVNSDASVRALEKAPGRPVNAWRDRAEVVAALACVDAVVAFGESTPEALMARLKPDVQVKGGDYKPSDLPEARHAGRVVIVPLKKGYSTTGLIKRLQGKR